MMEPKARKDELNRSNGIKLNASCTVYKGFKNSNNTQKSRKISFNAHVLNIHIYKIL